MRKGSFSAGRISLARGPEIPCRDRRSPLCRWTDVSGLHAVRGAASRTAGVRGARAPRTVCRPAHGGSLRVGGWSSPRAPQAPPKVCGRCRCGGCRRGSLRGARAARRGWAAAGNPRSSVLRMHGRAARGGARARGREPVLRHSACDVFGERRVRVCSGHPVPRSSRAAGAADKCPFAIHSAGAHCSSRVWGHGRGPFAPPNPRARRLAEPERLLQEARATAASSAWTGYR